MRNRSNPCITVINNNQIVIRMIAGGANLNALNGSGRSALILAARKQHYEIALVLVESGATPGDSR